MILMVIKLIANQDEIHVLAPTGATGSGFLDSTFERGLALTPHFIGGDAGSTDPCPEFLGSGGTAFPLAAIKRDLRLMMIGARKIKVPRYTVKLEGTEKIGYMSILIGSIRDPFIIRHQALHLPIPEWSGLITAIACPYNPLECGAVYKFNVNHAVEPDSPTEMFPMSLYNVNDSSVEEISS